MQREDTPAERTGKSVPGADDSESDDVAGSAFSPTLERLRGALAGSYEVIGEIGSGGMATVYGATDLKHARKVALKVLRPDLSAALGAERFFAEIETTAKLQHPHILPLHDSGSAGGLLYYVMPFVDGESLRQRLDREGQLPVEEATKMAVMLAGALAHAHRRGVIHRDLKPANILLQDGQPVMADFGIALAVDAAGGSRLTETGLSVGTPHYMSPEQATGDRQVGPASDVYALGCVLYEMLVGEPPFQGRTVQAILGRIVTGEVVPASKLRPMVPRNVDAAIDRALEKVPADRFGSADQFAAALQDPGFGFDPTQEAALGGLGARRWRLLAGVAGLVAFAALATPEMPIGTDMNYAGWDVEPDGQSFLFMVRVPPSSSWAHLVVIQNLFAMLAARETR